MIKGIEGALDRLARLLRIWPDLSVKPFLLLTGASAAMSTLLAAEAVYQCVQRPAIAFRKRLGREVVPARQRW